MGRISQPTDLNGVGVRIGMRLDSYRSFFDHEWAQRIGDLAQGTKLDGAVFALCMNWKATANTHMLPWLIVEAVVNLLHGTMIDMKPLAETVARGLKTRLVKETERALSKTAKKRIQAVVDAMVANACDARTSSYAVVKSRWGRPAFWQELVKAPEFQLSLWGSQRVCYCGIYYAYEHFARTCVALASRKSLARRPKKFVEAATGALGKSCVDHCLTDPEVTQARLARNALAHNGGRVTAELMSIGCPLAVENDVIQVMPEDTTHLFHVLKDRAYPLAQTTLGVTQRGPNRP
jgi:hypothetical protein